MPEKKPAHDIPDAKLIDGSRVAKETLAKAEARVATLKRDHDLTPCLVTILVGSDPSSIVYTQMKRRRCEAIGMTSRKVELPEETTTEELVKVVTDLGNDASVHGILLQHPAPKHVDERAAFEAIPVAKDVDGVTWGSYARMWFAGESDGTPSFDSCTPGGMIRLMDAYDLPIEGKHAVVIGRSAILGKPMAGLLLERNATVTVCHSRTQNLPDLVRQADIIVAAVGRPNFVQGDWVKEGAVVLDAGYNPGNVGDVDIPAATKNAAMITPVPGGVGPMTIATLIDQTVTAAEAVAAARAS